ncbi:MAG: sulfotransferase family 2 domain-containing protein [Rhodobacteraceae bacterium]|nr:sulfotransferase family 2 domain-containing protein [Paracoccaceae bacterium]
MISHAHKTVFVHIPKTAGQSIEMVFLRDLGLTWKERSVLHMLRNKDPEKGPKQLGHLYASEYVRCGHISQDNFAKYTKFTVVRHPYDRVISEYRYRVMTRIRRNNPRDEVLDFDAFIRRDADGEFTDMARHLVPQTRYIFDKNGQCLVDRILRFETLSQDIGSLFIQLFGSARALPYRNKSRAEYGLTPDNLTQEQKQVLQVRYRRDFEAFNYNC